MSHFQQVELSKLVERIAKRDPGKEAPNDTINYIDISSIDRASKQISEITRVKGNEAPSRARQLVRTADVLVSTVRPNLNAVAQVPEELDGATASTGYCVLRPKNGRLDSRYLFHWVRTPVFVDNMVLQATGASYPAVTDKIVKASKIPLPPLAEQQRIAAILDKAEALRAKRRAALAKLDTLLQSTFLDMFGDPVTNPKGWRVVKLGEISKEVRYGTSVKCHTESSDDTLPILRIPNIIGGELDWSDLKFAELNQKEIEKLIMKSGDLLFVRSNGNPDYIGRCAVFKETQKAAFASYLIRARLKKDGLLEPDFVQQTMSFPTYRSFLVKEARTTAGNYNISGSRLKTLPIFAPPRTRQGEFLEFKNRLDLTKHRMSRDLEQHDSLFYSLQQRAFKGKL